MGPSQAGSSPWPSGPRVTATSTAPRGPADAAALGANLSKTAAPTLKKERAERRVHVDEDAEVYSDPDDGVEIVDMKNVQAMDWMAPESLKCGGARDETKKKVVKVKREVEEPAPLKGKGARIPLGFRDAMLTRPPRLKAKQEAMVMDGQSPAVDDVGDINLANALDLSESEEEEEMEDIINDFSLEREVNR